MLLFIGRKTLQCNALQSESQQHHLRLRFCPFDQAVPVKLKKKITR